MLATAKIARRQMVRLFVLVAIVDGLLGRSDDAAALDFAEKNDPTEHEIETAWRIHDSHNKLGGAPVGTRDAVDSYLVDGRVERRGAFIQSQPVTAGW